MEAKGSEPVKGTDSTPTTLSFWQKTGPRLLMFGALVGPAATVFWTQHRATYPESLQMLTAADRVIGSTIKPTRAANVAAVTTAPTAYTASSEPVAVDVIASPAPSVIDQPSVVQLTTTPAAAKFAVFSGIIPSKIAPDMPPLRTGTSPGTAEQLRAGEYTIFLHKDGWPDSRIEIQIQAGEVRPVEYSFPHGEVTITSAPSGAEIFDGAIPLGSTPVSVDLPPGERTLTARLKNYPDRSQTIAIRENETSTIAFRMQAHRRVAKAKPKASPSLIERMGGSLKHLFSANPAPAAPRKR